MILTSASFAYGQREGQMREPPLRDLEKLERQKWDPLMEFPERQLEGCILLINDSADKVTFNLKNKDTDWCSFDLNGNTESTYKNTSEIKIVTEGKGTVDYALETGQRYKIFWNTDRKLWDVAKLVPK